MSYGPTCVPMLNFMGIDNCWQFAFCMCSHVSLLLSNKTLTDIALKKRHIHDACSSSSYDTSDLLLVLNCTSSNLGVIILLVQVLIWFHLSRHKLEFDLKSCFYEGSLSLSNKKTIWKILNISSLILKILWYCKIRSILWCADIKFLKDFNFKGPQQKYK